MKIAVVSSTALLTTPWSSLHHMPLPRLVAKLRAPAVGVG